MIVAFKVGRLAGTSPSVFTLTDHFTTDDNIPNDILDGLSVSIEELDRAQLCGETDAGLFRPIVHGDVLLLATPPLL